MTAPLFSKEDMTLLRKPIFLTMISLGFSALLYVTVDYVNGFASTTYNQTRLQFEQVQTSIQQIAEEEATIVEYIDRYRQMVDDALFEEEDRLALLESVQSIRRALRLFTVDIELDQMVGHTLSYPPEEIAPGEPVQLQMSPMRINFALLHEEDLAGLVTELMASRGYYIPVTCQIRSTVGPLGFVEVADNLSAECEFLWLSFLVNPPETVNVE